MAVVPAIGRDIMEVVDYYQHLDKDEDRPARGPTVAVNGYVYASRNHPSSYVRPRRMGGESDRPQNIKQIMQTMDKEKFNQERLRRQKQKYETFVREPMMGRPVIETPGIGPREAKLLQRHGIMTSTDLRENYLDVGKKDFILWLYGLGIEEADAKECSLAIHDWCVKYIQLPR